MKISLKKIKDSSTESSAIKIGEYFLLITDDKFILNIKNGSKQFFFEGEIYYYVEQDKTFTVSKNEYPGFLKKRLENFEVSEFINSVEGIYNAVYINTEKNEAIIFCDYLNRKNFFYTEKDESFIASTSLENIVNEFSELKYNQLGLLSYITMGYTPIYQTLYDGINRFKSNEYIKIANGKILQDFFSENYSIEKYNDSHLNKYDSLLSNSILSRSSSKNVVLNSGGWDSTSIIYHLLKSHNTGSVDSVVYETKLKSGEIYNVYEVDKVKRISDYYGIKSEKIEIDFGDKKLINDWEKIRSEMKNYHTYFFVDMPKAVNDIATRNKSASIFSGEASDSIHNFGFSQFVSVTYQSRELREYGDKMKSYLFSPSFYTKVLNDTYSGDKVFQFFEFYFNSYRKISAKDKLNFYFKSFMLSSERIPFAKIFSSPLANDYLNSSYQINIDENIFDDLIDKTSNENLYYSLLQLYRAYHFHSPQIEVKHSPLRSAGENCKIPFLDSSLVKYMYSMPEGWGRGLELRPTKYPLRYLANEKWDIPVDILEESGAHSYIAETDKRWNYSGGSWSLAAETIYNSVFGEHYKLILSEIEIEKYFYPEYFDTKALKQIMNDFVSGKQDLVHCNLIYKLGVLFFIGLYD